MKKLRLVGLFTILAVLLFGISSFAANNNMATDAVDGIRNIVGGAENAVEGAVNGITGGVRSGIEGVEHAGENTVGALRTDANNGNGGYGATRTATTRMATNTGNTGTFLGMGATAWGWLIMSIVGIITVALVWYYGQEREANYNHSDDNY